MATPTGTSADLRPAPRRRRRAQLIGENERGERPEETLAIFEPSTDEFLSSFRTVHPAFRIRDGNGTSTCVLDSISWRTGLITSVPACHVSPGRQFSGGARRFSGVHLVIAQPADCVGLFGVAVPAVLGPIAVEYLAAIGWVGGFLQKVFHQVDGIIEVKIVHVADVDVDLALEVFADLGPIALEDRVQVVVLLPIFRHVRIDDAGALVPDRLGVAVGPDRRVDGLPDIPLLPGPALGAEGELVAVGIFERRGNMSQVIAGARPFNRMKGALVAISVLVLVDINDGISAEVNRVGAGRVASVVLLGIEDLGCQGFPATGRAAVEESRQPEPRQRYFFSIKGISS